VGELSKEARYLMLYLITNPHSHMSGIYYLPLTLMMEETSLGRGINRVLKELADHKMAFYDADYKQIFVVNMLEYQGRGQKVEKGVADYLLTMHNCPLIQRFLSRYPRIRAYLPASLTPQNEHPIDTLSMGGVDFPSPVPVPVPSSIPSSSEEEEKSEKEEETVAWVVDAWNAIPGVKLTRKVGDHLRCRIVRQARAHPGRGWWDHLFVTVQRSDFLCGRSTDFSASLDWALGPKNLEKIENGNYDNREPTAKPGKPRSLVDLL
jgi:hypothetical protein